MYSAVEKALQERIEGLQMSIKEQQEGLNSASESTAGDKHNTSRAMMHLEIEKAQTQMEAYFKLKQMLSRINTQHVSEVIAFGSLIETQNGWLFLSIPFGSVLHEGTSIQCISLASPLGQLLKSKTVGDEITFQSKSWQILKVL